MSSGITGDLILLQGFERKKNVSHSTASTLFGQPGAFLFPVYLRGREWNPPAIIPLISHKAATLFRKSLRESSLSRPDKLAPEAQKGERTRIPSCNIHVKK